MTVYVDNMRRRAQLQGRPANWSHLMADTHQELMDMAAEMGLLPEWLQHPGTHREHFDVTDAKRTQAIGFGAVEITYPHGTAWILAAKRAAEETPCSTCGSVGACAYDSEGRALIHTTEDERD